jgi:hypothetical protein
LSLSDASDYDVIPGSQELPLMRIPTTDMEGADVTLPERECSSRVLRCLAGIPIFTSVVTVGLVAMTLMRRAVADDEKWFEVLALTALVGLIALIVWCAYLVTNAVLDYVEDRCG